MRQKPRGLGVDPEAPELCVATAVAVMPRPPGTGWCAHLPAAVSVGS